MRALDLFCGGGGASAGLVLAGCSVVGVDIAPQPHYPFVFGQADALLLPVAFLRTFDLIWASPPCQRYAKVGRVRGRHEDLVGATRALLDKAGVPYVIENVPGSPLRPDLLLCGSMFGLRVIRHRVFEVHGLQVTQPRHEPHHPDFVSVSGQGGWADSKRRPGRGGEHRKGTMDDWVESMGIDWLPQASLSQAIPPAYSRHIARALVPA